MSGTSQKPLVPNFQLSLPVSAAPQATGTEVFFVLQTLPAGTYIFNMTGWLTLNAGNQVCSVEVMCSYGVAGSTINNFAGQIFTKEGANPYIYISHTSVFTSPVDGFSAEMNYTGAGGITYTLTDPLLVSLTRIA
jgi:hypothetical protein